MEATITIAELTEKLKKFPDDSKVVLRHNGCGFCDMLVITEHTAYCVYTNDEEINLQDAD